MFDGGRGGVGDGTTWDDEAVGEEVARMCDRFDPLLQSGAAEVGPAAVDELRTMARIYDLDDGGTPAEVWRALRPVLTRQTSAEVVEFGPLTILLAEDDPEVAAALTESLVDAGHAVIGPFSTAEAAAAGAALASIDVALLDINLAGPATGATLAEDLRRRFGARTVFISGDVSAVARHAGAAVAVVTKPFTTGDVLRALGRISRD